MRRFDLASRAPQGALLLLLAAVPVAASLPSISIDIAPPYVEKMVSTTSTVSDTIAFANEGTVPVLVSVDLADFGVDEAGQVSEEPPGSQPGSLAPYLHISPSTLTVAPRQKVFFRYSADTPADFKQLRAMVYLSSRPDVPARANQVVVVARMGVPIYVENLKADPASLRIEEAVWKRSGEKADALTLSLTATNEGERNIRPDGFVLVRSSDGKFERSYGFNEGREPVLPGQKRHWEMTVGPVPAEALAVTLRFATSPRASYESKIWIPALGS